MPMPGPDALNQTEAQAFVPLPLNLDKKTAEFYGARGVEAVFTQVRQGGPVATVPKTRGQSAKAFSIGDRWYARVPSVCPHLTTEGTCRQYATRPQACREGPSVFELLHVLSPDECTLGLENGP
jgi:Fe-S-cluster containining protein